MSCNTPQIYRFLTRGACLGLALSSCSAPHEQAADPTSGTLAALPARDAGGDASADVVAPGVTGCGNQSVAPPEQCDPPGPDDCDAMCLLGVPNAPPPDGGTPPAEVCGDGTRQGAEACDDGNLRAGDGCDATCLREGCGNGRLEPTEDCEPPGVDKCDSTCHPIRVECGDAELQAGEECDDGNVAFGDGCSPSCLLEACGNGRIEAPFESCEPPGGSACGPACRAPICGDGRVDRSAGEECEDGNLRAGDGCNPNCRGEACGNAVLDGGEQCDPPDGNDCGPDCQSTDASAPSSVAGPVEARAFLIQNSSFAGSLEPWEVDAPQPAAVQFGGLDAGSAPRSASAQVNLSAESPYATLWQCVRTSEGVSYQLSAATRGLGASANSVPVEMGVAFYEEEDCSGEVFDGVRTYNIPTQNGRWLTWALPPPSPIANVESTFEVPEGARSMMVWVHLEEDAADGANSVLVDDVRLVRASPPSCGDGIPESSEECEPSVTPDCLASCQLERACGDGRAAPGECATCPEDCLGSSPLCGDGVVTLPEQCEPAGVGACRTDCTWGSNVCGNGRLEGNETCDPPDGLRCGSDCTRIDCGNRRVEPPEECDPPRTPQCSRHCRLTAGQPSTCGDGLLQGAEQCDPPNPATWCSKACQRRDPSLACGDGATDHELEEECDPPGPTHNCGRDCRVALCGDEQVGGAEECDPPNETSCGADCRFRGDALECKACLGERCRAVDERDLFSACFEQQGFALAGPAQNAPRSLLCAEVVECLRATGCAAEVRTAFSANPAACYCGKAVLTNDPVEALRACRDGLAVPDGPCRAVFERAAESVRPDSVMAAILAARDFPTALSTAIDLMQQCGQVTSGCQESCTVAGSCGNGVVEPGELCEPSSDPYCAPGVCAVLPCGNGVVDASWPYGQPDNPDPVLRDYQQPGDWVAETCDLRDPFTNQERKCDESCHLIVTCGDGELNPSAEACDPGAPDQDWSGCCRPDSSEYAGSTQLSSCDRNGNGRIDRIEQCQVPAVCGNGLREGTEECDLLPPNPTQCLDCKAVDACSECTRAECAAAQRTCFESPIAATRVGCGEVLECYNANGCGRNAAFATCLCGDRVLLQEGCGLLGPNGPCAEVMQKNLPCGKFPDWTFSCVQTSGTDIQFGTGAALQVVNCRKLNCAAECGYEPFGNVDE